LYLISSDCYHQVLFQKRSFANMCVHHWIKEAVFSSIVSGARQCNMRTSEKLIDSDLPSPSLSYTYVCAHAELLYADVKGFLHLVPVGNSILLATDIESGDAPALCERSVA
jgi:hypothetical protein